MDYAYLLYYWNYDDSEVVYVGQDLMRALKIKEASGYPNNHSITLWVNGEEIREVVTLEDAYVPA